MNTARRLRDAFLVFAPLLVACGGSVASSGDGASPLSGQNTPPDGDGPEQPVPAPPSTAGAAGRAGAGSAAGGPSVAGSGGSYAGPGSDQQGQGGYWGGGCGSASYPIGGAGGASTQPTGVATKVGSGPDTTPAPVCGDELGFPPSYEPPAGCYCTRRPGHETSPTSCVTGSGQSVSFSVGPAGGVLQAPFSQIAGVAVSLVIPPGALTETTIITISETTVPPPASFVDWSPVYRFAPVDLELLVPATVVIPWQNLAGTVDGPLAAHGSTDGCNWAPLADSYVNAGFHQASTKRLGYAFSGFSKGETYAACP